MSLLRGVQTLSRRFGVEISRARQGASKPQVLRHLLKEHEVNTVLDVGANVGQYALYLRSLGYRGQIVSFEPLADAHASLLRASRSDPAWHVAPRMAIGFLPGLATINVSSNSVSSSILPMLPAHLDAAPESKYVRSEQVQVERIDVAALPYLAADSSVLLKIDTQGFERHVIDGVTGLLCKVALIQIELSLIALYDGQSSLLQVLAAVSAVGFEPWAFFPEFNDPRSGRHLQIDALFVRPRP